MDTNTSKRISPYSASMIGQHAFDRHSEARDKFKQEAQVVSSYLKTLHPHRKDGHLQLNYPSTIRRLNQNNMTWTPGIPSKSESFMLSNSPTSKEKTEIGIIAHIISISPICKGIIFSDSAQGAHGEHESVYLSRESRQLQEATIQQHQREEIRRK